ncbi:uncharacterized protein LOC129228250 [Uloborus diversus]|uniref:uncharacterized protein LOC129228250 n=1 Tax=Uloborus diversus TaxID=327109 RepID=UPI0024094FC6|nr:uncharacterized protein LOC129228250 [Uloborus diversus]
MLTRALLFILLFTSDINRQKSNFMVLSAASSADRERDYYPCYRDLNCELGEELETRAMACLEVLQDESREEVFEWIKEASKGIITSSDLDEYHERLCAADENLRKEGFRSVMQRTFDYFMMNCNGESESDMCENIREMAGCLFDLVEENVEKEKCGYLVDLQKRKLK